MGQTVSFEKAFESAVQNPNDDKIVRAAFKYCDADGNGVLEDAEIRLFAGKMLGFLQDHEHAAPEQVERAMAHLVDAGHALTLANFKAYLVQEKAVRDTIETSGWSALYRDVLLLVLGRLDVMELARCKRVCRHWNAVASTPVLWQRFDSAEIETWNWPVLVMREQVVGKTLERELEGFKTAQHRFTGSIKMTSDVAAPRVLHIAVRTVNTTWEKHGTREIIIDHTIEARWRPKLRSPYCVMIDIVSSSICVSLPRTLLPVVRDVPMQPISVHFQRTERLTRDQMMLDWIHTVECMPVYDRIVTEFHKD